MPFTLSHPAAAVPLARLGLPLAALVVGSVAPDLLYFLTLRTDVRFGHTVAGAVLFCLPAGLVGLWLFDRVMKRPLLDLLPVRWQRQLAPACGPFTFLPPRRLVLVSGAIVLGAFTHIIWDGLTAYEGWGVSLMPVLLERVDLGLPETMAYHRVLQHISTLLGAILLVVWIAAWIRRTPPSDVEPMLRRTEVWTAWLAAGLVVLALGLFNASRFAWFDDPYWMQVQALVHGVVGMIAGALLAMLIYSVMWWMVASRRRQDVPR